MLDLDDIRRRQATGTLTTRDVYDLLDEIERLSAAPVADTRITRTPNAGERTYGPGLRFYDCCGPLVGGVGYRRPFVVVRSYQDETFPSEQVETMEELKRLVLANDAIPGVFSYCLQVWDGNGAEVDLAMVRATP